MKKFLWMLPLILTLAQGYSRADETQNLPEPGKQKSIYVIPVRSDIDSSIVYVIRRGIKEAMANDADAIILHMDTYGGRVDKTEEITQIIRQFPNQENTYTYIDTKAISAGAYIASATRQIFMAPASVIGAATPVMMAPGGQAQAMNESYEEKMKSALKGLVRANAEFHGHNPEVFDAMIDRDQGLKIGDEVVVEEGKVLTLTSQEAAKVYGDSGEPLLSAGTVDSLDALVERIAGPGATITKIEPTGMEQIAKFIVTLSPLLMAGAFLFGYIEFKTPGLGVFGAVAVVCALLFFFGHYIAGLSGQEFLVLLAIGVALIAVEIFILPGTIVPGLLGLGCLAFGLLLAMADIYPEQPVEVSLPRFELPAIKLIASMMLAFLGAALVTRLLPATPFYKALLADGDLRGPTPLETIKEERHLETGMTGTTLTVIRPSGTVDFGEGPVDVVSQGDFINRGQSVKIIEITKSRVIVEEA